MSDGVASLLNLTIEEVSLKIDQFKTSFDGLNSANVNIKLDTLLNNGGTSSDELLIPSEIKDSAIKAITDKELVTNITKKTLEYIKEILPTLMKGKGKVWIDNASRFAGKWAGPAINVGFALYDIYSANKEHQEMVENERRRVHAMQSCVTEIASTLSHHLELEFQKVVQQAFNPLIKTYQEVVNAISFKNSNLSDIKKELIKISNEIK